MHLLDINVWLALAFEAHEHHRIAREWFDGIPDETCSFCRMTQQGFLRLSTNPAVFGKEALSLTAAWKTYDAIMSDPRVFFSSEPDGMETTWRKYTHLKTWSPKVWNDAYLAAFAKCSGYSIISFDRGFGKYKGIDCVIPGTQRRS